MSVDRSVITIEKCLDYFYKEFLKMGEFLSSSTELDKAQALSLLLVYFRENIIKEGVCESTKIK